MIAKKALDCDSTSRFKLKMEVKDMMKTGEVSKLTGIEKRTLQRYVEWGLISPERSEAGYMLFSGDDLTTLFLVKLFKDLGYTTKEVREAFVAPGFDVRESLDCRISELETQLRKGRERLLLAREVRKLIGNGDGPNTGEAMHALLRHPEYAWILADEGGEGERELIDYFKWAESVNGRMADASVFELDERIAEIIEESKEFGPFAYIANQMLIALFDLEAQGIPARSEEANAVVAAAYSAAENANEDDPYVAFYMLGKFYKEGGMTPPSMMARMDERSLERLRVAEAYMAEALSGFIETLELTEERRKEIEKLED